MNKRDVYEVSNQLGGYVGPNTDKRLAAFLIREAGEACKLADEIIRLRSENARIRKAAEAVIQQWDTPNWKLQEPTAKFINALRAELSQANTEGRGE